MARPSKPHTSVFDFTVEQRKTYIPHNGGYSWTGKWSNVRTDTGESLGDGISEQYGLLQNSVLVESLETAFNDFQQLHDFKREISVTENGARFYGRYSFPRNKRILTPAVGDSVGMVFDLRNSFDRSTKAGLGIGSLRLLCLNGMTSTENMASITARHTNKINVGTIKDGIEMAIERWESSVDKIAEFSQREVTQEQGIVILNNLAQKKVLSESLKDSIEFIWNGQVEGLGRGGEADKARNLWNLYNATTEHLTHQVAPKRFEYSRSVENKVLTTFTRGMSDKKLWEGLLKPVPKNKEDKTVTLSV
jgi:hypothetical protein